MKLLSWNIQWARGMDGRVDLPRILRTIHQLGDFDLICLQEVAVNFPGLPGCTALYGAATDVPDGGGRSLCGDMNFPASAPERSQILAPFAGGEPGCRDTWSVLHPNEAHAPTVGIHPVGFVEQAEYFDFVFVTEGWRHRCRDRRVGSPAGMGGNGVSVAKEKALPNDLETLLGCRGEEDYRLAG